ncbi:MAG: hypothetical protein ACYC99_14945 [Candidatus Geothermincolia bacterium]
MTERDLKIIELRKMSLPGGWIAREVGCCSSTVYNVLARERPDLSKHVPHHRVLRRSEVEYVLHLRAKGLSKELIRKLTGMSWDTQQRIYKACAPHFLNPDLDRRLARDAQIIRLRRQGVIGREIARLTGCARSTVTSVISEQAPELNKRELSPVDEIMELHDQGMSGAAIGRSLGMKGPTVTAVIRRRRRWE